MVEYNELTGELVAELAAIVGEDNCLTGEDINEDYAHDEMPIYGTHMPDAVVLPANTDEVSAIMKLASANNIPVTAVSYTHLDVYKRQDVHRYPDHGQPLVR